MVYFYAVTDRPAAPLPPVRGIEDEELAALSFRNMAAVISPYPRSQAPVTAGNLLRHEAVLEALMVDRTVLPARFGAIAPDEAAVRDALAHHRVGCEADLERLRGRVEFGLRVLWEGAGSRAPTPVPARLSQAAEGRAYLLARLKEERRNRAWRGKARALAVTLCQPLEQLAVESTRRLLVTPRTLLSAAYLVEWERAEDFQEAVRGLAAARGSLDFLCTGPWPPFNFVSATLSATIRETRQDAEP